MRRWQAADARVLMPLVICLTFTACSSGRNNPPDSTPLPTASANGEPASPLKGEWASEPVPAADMLGVILEAGFTRKDAEQVLGEIRSFEFTLRFEDGQYALLSAWDGEDVGEVERGPYRLEGDRLSLGVSGTGDANVFALNLQGDHFTLELLANSENGTVEEKYMHSYFTTAFYTGHVFTKTT